MVTILLANGFEIAEALVTQDLLHRAGVDARLTGLNNREMISANGVAVKMDQVLSEMGEETFLKDLDMLILAGGLENALTLKASPTARSVLAAAAQREIPIAAICAAPTVLADLGLLEGVKAVCYPGMEPEMDGAIVQPGSKVVADGRFVTGQGPGAAFDFALKLVEVLKGEAVRKAVQEEIHYQ